MSRLITWVALAFLLLALALSVLAPIRADVSWIHALAAVGAFAVVAAVAEWRLRRERPFESHGRMARWRHPSRWPFARAFDLLANSRLVSAWVEPLPIAPMVSDIEDVVYVNYLVEASMLERLVPWALELERLGPGGRYALFSILTYRHGHFSFRFLGPLRRLFPSPVQSNWRIHVMDPRTKIAGIFFVTNAIDHGPPALAARLFTEGMPMHVFARSRIARDARTGAIELEFVAGEGTAPDARAALAPCEAPALEGPWRECFGDWAGFLNYCVPQHRAMSAQPWHRRVTRHEISLPIDVSKVEPLSGDVRSTTASKLVGDASPLCFRVGGLHFTFEAELHDPVPRAVETSTSA